MIVDMNYDPIIWYVYLSIYIYIYMYINADTLLCLVYMYVQTSVLVNPRESMLEGIMDDLSQDSVNLMDLSSHSNYDSNSHSSSSGGHVSRMMSEGGTNINPSLPASTAISAATENELKGDTYISKYMHIYMIDINYNLCM